jgi:hypothetical protein
MADDQMRLITTMIVNRCWREGAAASEDLEPACACPYDDELERSGWFGWSGHQAAVRRGTKALSASRDLVHRDSEFVRNCIGDPVRNPDRLGLLGWKPRPPDKPLP